MSKKNTKAQAAVLSSPKEFTFLNRKFSQDDLICTGLLVILIMVVALIRSKFLTIPFERDEGAYSYYGKLLLQGFTPYKDFYEQKFPGIFYFYATMVYLFGDDVKSMHTGFMYLNILTIIFIYFTSRNLFSPLAGIISAITYAFVSLTPNLSGFTVQSEHGVAFFTSLGLLFFSLNYRHNKLLYILLMGLSFGLAFMTKTSGVFFVLWGGLVLIINFLFNKERKFKSLLIEVLTYSVAVFFVIGLFFLLIILKGSFKEMIFWAYTIPKGYVNAMPFEEGIKYFGYTRDAILKDHKFFWVHGFLVILVCLLRSVPLKMKVLAITLLAFSILPIVPGFYFYGHYFIQIIPGLAVVSGLTFYGIITFLREKMNLKQPALKYIYVGVFVLLTLQHMNALKSYYFHPNYERILRTVYGANPFPESMEIANWLSANTRPEDEIALIGSEPQVYFYTKKKLPSRHAYFAAIVSSAPEHKEWQREFVADLEKAKPRYIVLYNHSISLLIQPNADRYVFDWANKYLTENYHVVGVADMVDGLQTNYVWKDALAGFQPRGQYVIYTYERNEPAPAVKP